MIPICLNSEDYDIDQLLNEENSDNSDIDNKNNEKFIITNESDENEQGEFDCLTKRSLSFYSDDKNKRQNKSKK